MKVLTATIFLFASAYTFVANQPSDGFYMRSQDTSKSWVLSQDSKKLFLGRKQDLNIQTIRLRSQNNANTWFYLSVTVPFDKNLGHSSYLLIVAGTAYRQSVSGSSHNKTSSLGFNILGEGNAKQVSGYLKTPVVYRRHPYHNLLVSFVPTKKKFSIGDEVTATLRIKNVGVTTISFMKGGRNRAARDNQYVFSARLAGRQIDDLGTSFHFGGIAVKRVLKPQEVFDDNISLSKWFAFDKEGMYQIHGAYYLDFIDPESEQWNTIWDDYVSADFTVTIREKGDDQKMKRQVETYVQSLNEHDLEKALSMLSDDFKLHFTEYDARVDKKGMVNILGWDKGVNGVVSYEDLVAKGDLVTGLFSEQNDFFKLIGINEFKAKVSFTFDESGLMVKQSYTPLPNQPSFLEKMQPAIEWAKKSKPEELAKIYRDNQIQFTEQMGKRWVLLLKEWKRSTRD